MGSECEPTLGHFKSTLGASRITSTAYQVVVHMGLLVGLCLHWVVSQPCVVGGGVIGHTQPHFSTEGVSHHMSSTRSNRGCGVGCGGGVTKEGDLDPNTPIITRASSKQHVLGFIHAPSQFENRSRSHVLPRVCLSCVALPDVSTSLILHISSPAILRETSEGTSY